MVVGTAVTVVAPVTALLIELHLCETFRSHPDPWLASIRPRGFCGMLIPCVAELVEVRVGRAVREELVW